MLTIFLHNMSLIAIHNDFNIAFPPMIRIPFRDLTLTSIMLRKLYAFKLIGVDGQSIKTLFFYVFDSVPRPLPGSTDDSLTTTTTVTTTTLSVLDQSSTMASAQTTLLPGSAPQRTTMTVPSLASPSYFVNDYRAQNYVLN